MTTASADNAPLPDPQLAYDTARDQLSYQLAAADSIVAKGGTFFAVGSTLVGVALLALRPGLSWVAWLALTSMALSYTIMTAISVRLFGEEKWWDGPDVRALARDLFVRPDVECKWRATRTLVDHRDGNQGAYKKRLRALRVTGWSLVIETLSLVALGLIVARG